MGKRKHKFNKKQWEILCEVLLDLGKIIFATVVLSNFAPNFAGKIRIELIIIGFVLSLTLFILSFILGKNIKEK